MYLSEYLVLKVNLVYWQSYISREIYVSCEI